MTSQVATPVTGLAMPLSQVPDPVFSQAMAGPGMAVDPERGAADALAPVDGTVVTLHPHAFVVAGSDGGVLVHLGIDTVRLNGTGFTTRVDKGAVVRAGQPIVHWDPAEIEQLGHSPVCPIIALDTTAEALSDVREDGHVTAGEAVFVWS